MGKWADGGDSTIVREYIKSVFRDLAWHVEEVSPSPSEFPGSC